MSSNLSLRLLFTVGLIILFSAGTSCGMGDLQESEQAVKVAEQRWLKNEDRPDVVASILADDFAHVLPVGFITKDEHLAYLRQHPRAFSGDKHFELLRVRIYAGVAIANGIVATVRDTPSSPKRTAFSDVFVWRDGKWLAVNAQELPLSPDGVEN